ncbi:MAG: DUF6152 family protein, partial [Pseudomonadales bacterium]|nr:DUF6152 family protein [Pseudomonadales bacterium]
MTIARLSRINNTRINNTRINNTRINNTRINQKTWFAVVLLIGTMLSIPTFSHHLTNVRFDTETDASINGVVTRLDWRNPHVYIYIDGTNEDGEQVTWEIEGPPPAALRRAGWSRETIGIGASVKVNGNPGRNAADNIFLFASLELDDGDVLGLEQSLAALPGQDAAITERASSLAGTWGTNFSYQANVKLIAASQLNLTEKGQQAVESYVEVTDNPALDCMPGSTPPATMLVPDIKSIEIRDDVVLLRAEHESIERTIFMNQDSHAGAVESLFGHSIGYWEGSTLVIDTTHFTPHRQGNATGLPSGERKHLIERLTLNEDGSAVTYAYE